MTEQNPLTQLLDHPKAQVALAVENALRQILLPFPETLAGASIYSMLERPPEAVLRAEATTFISPRWGRVRSPT